MPTTIPTGAKKIVTTNKNTYFTANNITIGTAAPTTTTGGTYAKGDIIINSAPSAEAIGWICTTEGSPGTWKAIKSGVDVTSMPWNSITGKPATFTPTLGVTSSTAFRGDHGNTAYQHSQAAHAPANAQKNSDITKAEIEAKLTGTITSHNHNSSYHTKTEVNNMVADLNTAINGVQGKLPVTIYKDDAGEMIYKGTEVNNYISFSGDVWRIIKLEADGSIKLAYPRYNKELSWDNDGSTEWSLSSLNNELNKNFYPKLQNTNVIDTRNWKIGRIFNVAQTKEDLKEYESKAYFGIADNASSLVGLPNTSDYISASNDDLCQSDVLNSKNCSSWLKYLPSWTINAASTLDGDVAVYYFENDSTGTKLNKKSPSEKFSVVPVIYLKSSTKIIGGDGSSSNPFILER